MPNFPISLDDDQSLYVAVNNLRTELTSNITNTELTIPVTTTSGFPNSGFITILSVPEDITQAEAIRYEGVTPTTFSGTARGASGTPALAHFLGDNVDLTIVADHHNELKDAVIAIEEYLGVTGAENFVPFTASNNVLLPNGLSVQNQLTVSGLATFSGSTTIAFATITGSLDVEGLGDFLQDVGVSGTLTADTGNFFQSLTISGVPVVAGGHIEEVNFQPGPSITITGTGGLETITSNNVITIDGSNISPSVSGTALAEVFRGALVFVSSGTAIPSANATTLIGWDSVAYDTDGFFDSDNPSFLTIPANVNKIKLHGQIAWEGTDPTGDRRLIMRKNDSGSGGSDPEENQIVFVTNTASDLVTGVQTAQQGHTAAITVSEGDFFDLRGRQDSGSTLDIGPLYTWFGIEVLDPLPIGPSHVVASSGTFSQSLTVSGSPVATGTNFSGVRSWTDDGGSPAHTVTIQNGIIQTWTVV